MVNRETLSWLTFWVKKITFIAMRDEPIPDPPLDGLGPCMLALSAQQRRFVVGWIGTRGQNGARVARAAGYSDHLDAAKVQACRLVQNPKVLAALREEADRRLDGIAVLAILGLGDLVQSKDEKIKSAAIDSALDRTGYSRRTQQDIRVEHTDKRSTAELLAAVRSLGMRVPELPALEAPYTDVKGDG